MQEQYTEDREMRRYLGAVLGLLLLLALAGCGNKAAENVEETPGDPTGTVKVVTPQEEQTPEASDGAEQQPTSDDQKTPVQQETRTGADLQRRRDAAGSLDGGRRPCTLGTADGGGHQKL